MEMGALSLTSKLTLVFALCVGSVLAQVNGSPGVTGGLAGSSAIGSLTGATQGQPLSGTSAGGTQSSGLYIDAKAYKSSCVVGTNDDACLAAAIAAIPSNGTGIVDMTGYGATINFALNPFAALSSTQGLANGVRTGVVKFSAGQTINTSAPIVIPTGWRVENWPNRWTLAGEATTWAPSGSFPACVGVTVPCNSTNQGSVTNTAPTCTNQQCLITVTGTSTAFSSSQLWMMFAVCVSGTSGTAAGFGSTGNACGTNPLGYNGGTGSFGTSGCTNDGSTSSGAFPCRAWGLIVAVNSATSLTVAVPAAGSSQTALANTNAVNYVIFSPLIHIGDINSSGINMGIQWTGGAIQTGATQNIGSGGAAQGCFGNYNSQEETSITFTQCQIGGTGVAVGWDIEGGSFNSGPYDNNIITAQGNCGASTILLVDRGNVSSSYTRPWTDTTLTTSSCNGGNGTTVVVDWETPGTFGPGIHVEVGATATAVDVNDTVICPVMCVMGRQSAQNSEIVDVNNTVGAATVVHIGTNPNLKGSTVRRVTANSGTLLSDANSGCTISRTANETTLQLYITGWPGANGGILQSTSITPGCQPNMALAPASITAAYSNATSGFTSLTGMKMLVAPSSTLKLTCYVTYSMTGTTPTGPSWQFTGPASPTLTTISDFPGEGGTIPTPISGASYSAITNAGSLVSGQLYTDVVTLMVQNGTTGGTVQLQGKPPSTSFTLAVAANSSYCQ